MTATSSRQPGVLIVGAGQAGAQLALSLRDEGYGDPITLIGSETHLPYQRPPLSKAYLLGDATRDSLVLRPETLFRDRDITLRLGASASNVDPVAGRISLADGDTLHGSEIVLATGSRARPLPAIAHATMDNVFYLRSLDDADRLADGLRTARRVAVVGGGFIGLEFAAVARRKFGCDVTVIEAGPQILGRMASGAIASHIRQRLTEWGVTVMTDAAVVGADTDESNKAEAFLLGDGGRVEFDMALIGIGGEANGELAGAPHGIAVDAYLAGAPGLSALGDCALFPDAAGEMHRVESVQNALDQARYLAKRFTGKEDKPYKALNWFWSDIGDMKLQIAGRAFPGDEVLAYSRGENRTVAYRFRNGTLSAVETINSPADHMLAKRLLASDNDVSNKQIESANGDLRACMA